MHHCHRDRHHHDNESGLSLSPLHEFSHSLLRINPGHFRCVSIPFVAVRYIFVLLTSFERNESKVKRLRIFHVFLYVNT